ncbi:DoxX family protein [Rhodovarius crocodyli]|nr:DoxX family protein [Rhodovarius crocodyli]
MAQPSLSQFDALMPIRVAAGLLYIPHWLYKVMNMSGSATFFESAGFYPGMFFLYLALVTEGICAVSFIFNIQVKWTGFMSAGVLAVAAYAVLATKGFGWLWNKGGIEYIVLWAFLSVVFAAEAWRREWVANGRLSLFGTPRYA